LIFNSKKLLDLFRSVLEKHFTLNHLKDVSTHESTTESRPTSSEATTEITRSSTQTESTRLPSTQSLPATDLSTSSIGNTSVTFSSAITSSQTSSETSTPGTTSITVPTTNDNTVVSSFPAYLIAIIAVSGVLVVAGIGGLAFYFFKRSKSALVSPTLNSSDSTVQTSKV